MIKFTSKSTKEIQMSMPPRIVGRVQSISTGYAPRAGQVLLHKRLKRFNVLMLHRRFGKSVFAINEMIDQALRNMKPYPVYGYFAPTFTLVEEIAWSYFKQFLKDVPDVDYNQQKLRIKIFRKNMGDHITIQLKSTDSINAAVGKYYDGTVLDEYQDINPIFFNKLMPTLSDRKGWLIILGTPRGDDDLTKKLNAFKDHASWYTCKIRASESGVISEEELEIQRASMLPEQYELEFECNESAALVGSYYGSIMEELLSTNKIGIYPHDPSFEVDTAWDLGMSDLNTIWFVQQVHGEVRVIDYLSNNGKGFDFYVGEMFKKKYVYRYHYLPHDIRVRELGSTTGTTREDSLYSLGIQRGSVVIAEKLSPLEGINVVRMLLPRCTFNLATTEEGVKCLRNYQRVYDPMKQVYAKTPMHNWASHGADGFRTLALALKPPSSEIRRNSLPQQAITEYNCF